jgi:septum formation protein
MILPYLSKLEKFNIILASKSPRRVELLSKQNVKFSAIGSTFEENLNKQAFKSHPENYALANAIIKAAQVFSDSFAENNLVIGSDTIVVTEEGEILEKPLDSTHAFQMLGKLSGRKHVVFTGMVFITLLDNAKERWNFTGIEFSVDELNYICEYLPRLPSEKCARIHCFVAETRVQFAILNQELIQAYVDSQEPFDKAGGVRFFLLVFNF